MDISTIPGVICGILYGFMSISFIWSELQDEVLIYSGRDGGGITCIGAFLFGCIGCIAKIIGFFIILIGCTGYIGFVKNDLHMMIKFTRGFVNGIIYGIMGGAGYVFIKVIYACTNRGSPPEEGSRPVRRQANSPMQGGGG